MGALDKFLALTPVAGSVETLTLAAVRVPDYARQSSRGGVERVRGYTRMGPDAMQAHLESSHGVGAAHFGGDVFSHPASLASWHGQDHLARSMSLGHGHALEHVAAEPEHAHAASHAAEHAAGGAGHEGGHGIPFHHLLTGGMLAHGAHEEIRRTADRQTRRRAMRVEQRKLHGGHHGAKAPGASGASGASGGSGSSGSGGNSGGGSGGSGGSSGSR